MSSQNTALFTVPVYQPAMASDLQLRQILQLFCSAEAADRILKQTFEILKIRILQPQFKKRDHMENANKNKDE